MRNLPDLPADRGELELLYEIVKQVPVAMALLKGPLFNIQIANDKALEIWGKSHQEVIHQPALDVFPNLAALGQVLNAVYTTGEPFTAHEMPVTLLRNGRNETLFLNFNYEAVRTSDGAIWGVVATGIDVTEQVAARRSVEENERQSFELLAQAAVGITVYQGDELRVLVANDSACEVWGKAQDELIGKAVLEISPELEASPAFGLVKQVLYTGQPFEGREIPIEFIRNGAMQKGYYDVVYTAWKGQHGEIKGVITVYTEVTHSVVARKKIEEKEAQLRIALEGGDLGYYDYHPQTGELLWSDRMLEMFGLPADAQPTLELFFELLHPDDREQVRVVMEQAMNPANGGKHDNEYRTVAASDGKVRWLHAKGKTGFDENNTPVRFTGVVRDITREKLSEDAVRRSEERFRNTFDNAAVGIAHVGLDGSWLMMNDRLCEIAGYSREELLTKTFQDITHESDLNADLHLLRELLSGKIDTYSLEKRYIQKQGSFIWVNLTVSLARDRQGNTDYIIAVVQDISEQKWAEEDLKRSEEQFRTLADNIQNLAWMADSRGVIFWYNQRWYDYTGATPQQAGQAGWEAFLHPEHVARANAFIQNALQQGSPFELSFPLRRHDGLYRWFLTRVHPIRNDSGDILRWVGTSTDIDEQKSVEERLEKLVAERTLALKRSNEDLQQFAHVASHDFKEPVRKIRTFSSRLTDEFGALLPEEGKLYLDKIESASERIYEMIDAILLYSSFDEHDKLNDQVDLTRVVQQIITDLELSIQEKGATIEYSDLPVIQGSSMLMYQLFYNLINNSLKFSRKDARPLIQLSSQPLQDGRIEIRLSDNGIGFRNDEAQTIFKAFTRLHSKRDFEGTGLGLSLCQRIVERHGGEIVARGEEGVGAEFVVRLTGYNHGSQPTPPTPKN